MPELIASSMLIFVAATILTFVFSTFDEPTFMYSPLSRILSNLTWVERGSSPTSSKKIVPPSATSKYPLLLLVAPVKAPFSCPNSSESIVPSGIAPQLTAIYFACFLCEYWWIILGIFSLPTPLSPVTRTEMSEFETWIDFSRALFSFSLFPIIPNLCFTDWIDSILDCNWFLFYFTN